LQDPNPVQSIEDAANAAYTTMADQVAGGQPEQAQVTLIDALTAETRTLLAALVATSDDDTAVLAASALVGAYAARPRIAVVSASLTASGPQNAQQTVLTFEADLLADSVRVIAAPGQADSVSFSFRFLRGMTESEAESAVFPQAGTVGSFQVSQSVGAVAVLNAATDEDIPVVDLAPGDVGALDGLSLSLDAKARITTALQAGMEVIVPASAVEINGQPAIRARRRPR